VQLLCGRGSRKDVRRALADQGDVQVEVVGGSLEEESRVLLVAG
jgi:hypothetical protein